MSTRDDLRNILASAATLTDLPTAVILASGAVVEAFPGLATVNDTVLGAPGSINGDERTLRFVAADVLGLKGRDLLVWNGKSWRVKHPQLLANGAVVKAFLELAL